MSKNKIELRNGILIAIILLAALSRLIPHPMNFTPIAAIGLFGAAYFSKKWMAFFIPLVALWISDLVINNVYYPIVFPEYYNGFTLLSPGWYWIYGAFALIIFMGTFLLKKVKPGNLLASSLLASVIFFLVTNFGTWMSGTLYPKTTEGLMACYTAAIPFFWNTLAGDFFFVTALFGVFIWLENRYPTIAAPYA